MLYNPSKTTATLCICVTVLLHTAGVISTTIVPDIKPTPPLEFPSDNLHDVRIIQVTEATINNNLTKLPNTYPGNNDVLNSHWQHINVIAKISENYTGNYTENYIENKYYNNHIEDSWSSIALTLLVLLVMAGIVLGCSALCLKKVLNLKITKQHLLIEDCDDSVMNDLIHIQHV